MDLARLPLFSMMSKRLAWLGRRQEVLAQNVANADTPGYRARDLKEPDFREIMNGQAPGPVRLVATRPGHLGGVRAGTPVFKAAEDEAAEVTLSGNSVVLEEQMMKVAKTAMDHGATVNLYRKHLSMIKAALGRPGGG